MSLAVIIPALNEAPNIGRAVAAALEQFPDAALIVVDGGSADNTRELARAARATVLESPRGRGLQCRCGAAAARQEWLLFLHADTLLPADAGMVATAFMREIGAQIATFRLRFDDPALFLRLSGWCTRFDSVFTRFGDQGILVRRSFYETVGEFPPWPLFEDVALLQRSRKLARIVSLPTAVTTSARRFNRAGPIRQQLRNGILLTKYLCGGSPERLASSYGRCAGAVRSSSMPNASSSPTEESRGTRSILDVEPGR